MAAAAAKIRRASKGGKRPVTGQNRAEYLSNPHRGTYLPKPIVAEIVSLRKSGLSYRQIAERVNRNVDTVMRVLHLPEVEQELDSSADQVLAAYRKRILKLVPEAIAGLEELVEARDRSSIAKLLFGIQVLTPRTETQVDVHSESEESCHSPEDRYFWSLHGHWPEERCECGSKPKGGETNAST